MGAPNSVDLLPTNMIQLVESAFVHYCFCACIAVPLAYPHSRLLCERYSKKTSLRAEGSTAMRQSCMEQYCECAPPQRMQRLLYETIVAVHGCQYWPFIGVLEMTHAMAHLILWGVL